jgi:hypothetical protein
MKTMPLITAIVLIMISCSVKPTLKSTETDEVLIDISYADESFLRKYNTYDSFIENEDHERIAFTSNIPVKDFSWLSLSINFDNDELIYLGIGEELYSIKELHPQKPFVVTWQEVGIFPNRGFSYRDKNGQKQYYALFSMNYGGDPEEYDGPDFAAGQIFPMKIVIGQYQYTDDETTLMLDLRETSYTLKINDVIYTGTAVIDFGGIGAEKDSWYVTLEGIKWAAWDKKSFSKPSGVELWFEEGEEGNVLVFQNHGNPMAMYTIFPEIGDKFVTLTK